MPTDAPKRKGRGYQLSVPPAGTMLYGGGDQSMVADSLDEAKDLWEDWTGERPDYMHSYIGVCRVLYKRDVDSGDCHEDAEPGDTSLDYSRDDGRELRSDECRVWEPGPPSWHWSYKPLPQEPIHPRDIPVGCSIGLRNPIRSARTTETPHEVDGAWVVDVAIWPDGSQHERVDVLAADVLILGTGDWPILRFELTVEGEVLGTGTEAELRVLRDERCAGLSAKWKADQDRAAASGGGDATNG